MTPEISVIIPTYNRAAWLPVLFKSLAVQVESPPFEILLADDCSTDATESVVADWNAENAEHPVRYLRMERNGGPGRARNAALRAAQGRVAAFTDSDCRVDRRWLGKLVRSLDPANRIIGVGGRIEPMDLGHVYARYSTVNRTLEPQNPGNTYLITCNCCYDRDALLDAGGFPESIPTPGGEDIAASIYLWKRGYRFGFDTEAVVYHDFRAGLWDFCRTYRNYGFGCAQVVHDLLASEEQNPHWGREVPENHWTALPIKPNVTGVRSFLRDQRNFYQLCKFQSRPAGDCIVLTALRGLDRISFYYGWRRGWPHTNEGDGAPG